MRGVAAGALPLGQPLPRGRSESSLPVIFTDPGRAARPLPPAAVQPLALTTEHVLKRSNSAVLERERLMSQGRGGVGITMATIPHWSARPESTLSGLCM